MLSGDASEQWRIDRDGSPLVLEVRRLRWTRIRSPLVVFLHEGLGSVSMWRDFPQRLCEALDCRGLVYSRPGYGASTPRAADERWQADFMHRQAKDILPALYRAMDLDPLVERPWLVGHSDGASIALLHAAHHPRWVSGLLLLAPHIVVEDITLQGVREARAQYRSGDLRRRLARHHVDPDSAFWGWNDVWLDPCFRTWSIVDEIAGIGCPVTAIQGLEDPYGTLAQPQGIVDRLPQARLHVLPACGHSPHREYPQSVIDAMAELLGDGGSRLATKEKPPI